MIRVKDDIWRDYEKLCAEEGTTRSEDIRYHVNTRISNSKVVRKV